MAAVTFQPTWVCTLATSHRRACLALVIIALLSFVPGFFTLPPVDRDEARYAQATRQMVETGDFIDIRLQDAPRYKQPVGIYWLQSAFVSVLGEEGRAPIFVNRMPSLLGAVASVLLVYWVALAFTGPQAAFFAGVLMASSFILGAEARLAKTDAVLLSATLLAQGVLARAYVAWKSPSAERFAEHRSWLLPALFWLALGLGTMVKGPIILVFVALTAGALALIERSAGFLKALKPWPWALLYVALVVPWFVAITVRSDGAFFATALGWSFLGKVTQGHEGHGAPPLTHLAWFWVIFWPGSVVFALTVRAIWRRRGEMAMRFMIAWVVPVWIVFEIVATKLPHYLLPAFPAIAIAASMVFVPRQSVAAGRLGRRSVQLAMVPVSIIVLIAVIAAARFAFGTASPQFTLSAPLAVIFAGASLWALWRTIGANDIRGFAVALIASTIATWWILYPLTARIDVLRTSPRLAEAIASHASCERPFLLSVGYGEPSLVFETRTDIVLAGDAQTGAERLAGQTCAMALVESEHLAAFHKAADELGVKTEEVAIVSGVNVGQTRWIDMAVLRVNDG